MKLKDKVAIVTGSAQGIGRAIAMGFAREGAKVVVADVNANKAHGVVDELKELGSEVLAVQVDVASEESVTGLKEQTLQRFGNIDILVNNAGIYPVSSVMEMSEELWDKVLDTNLGGNFLCSREVASHMRSRKSGRIICISSTIAFKGARNGAHYAASKAGIIGFVKALALEVACDGITVNALCPGVTETAQSMGHRSEEDLRSLGLQIPLGRVGRPEDMVGPVVFLASDAAAYITGQAVIVSGGGFMF